MVTELFAGIAVADLERAVDWYERLVGRPPDMRPHENEVCWQLAGSGWLYVVGDAERAGKGLLTLLVDDLDVELARLADQEIETGKVETIGDGVLKTQLTDPDGNRIALGQPPRAE